jgi:hypothetical protein
MDKLAQAKPIRWLEKRKYSQGKCTNRTKEKGSFPEPFKSCGRKSDKERVIT